MKNIIGPSILEELIVSGETFLAMLVDTSWHHILAGTVFQLDGASPDFSCHVHAFPDREFPEEYHLLGYDAV
jgi:hypothetical protein